MRYNDGKRQLSYVMTFPEAMRGLAEVCEYGANKYERYNYMIGGASAQQHVDCLFRHLLAWYEGEDVDSESGVNHLHHATFNMMRLADEMSKGTCEDDRPHKTSKDDMMELVYGKNYILDDDDYVKPKSNYNAEYPSY